MAEYKMYDKIQFKNRGAWYDGIYVCEGPYGLIVEVSKDYTKEYPEHWSKGNQSDFPKDYSYSLSDRYRHQTIDTVRKLDDDLPKVGDWITIIDRGCYISGKSTADIIEGNTYQIKQDINTLKTGHRWTYKLDNGAVIGGSSPNSWSRYIKLDSSLQGNPAEITKELLEEAQRRYPIGTKVKSLFSGITKTISRNDKNQASKSEKGYIKFDADGGTGTLVTVYEHGRWAEIESNEDKLIKEAKKRGFVSGCSYIDCNGVKRENVIGEPYKHAGGGIALKTGEGLIYQYGKWAELIKEPISGPVAPFNALEEAKRRYKGGMTVASAIRPSYHTILEDPIQLKESIYGDINSMQKGGGWTTIYRKKLDKWAEIISTPEEKTSSTKFKIGDKVKIPTTKSAAGWGTISGSGVVIGAKGKGEKYLIVVKTPVESDEGYYVLLNEGRSYDADGGDFFTEDDLELYVPVEEKIGKLDEYKGYKVGDWVTIMKKPKVWGSSKYGKAPIFKDKGFYPLVGQITSLDRTEADWINMNIDGYSFSFNDLGEGNLFKGDARPVNYFSMSDVVKEVSKESGPKVVDEIKPILINKQKPSKNQIETTNLQQPIIIERTKKKKSLF